jgi:hypothetical protein
MRPMSSVASALPVSRRRAEWAQAASTVVEIRRHTVCAHSHCGLAGTGVGLRSKVGLRRNPTFSGCHSVASI